MRDKLLKYIRCPICKSEFDLKIIKESNIEIEEGILTCKNCRFSTAITEGIVNLLFNLDNETLKETNLHIIDREEMFKKELESYSIEEAEKRWAYMEQESSKDYGKQVKKIFRESIKIANINKNDIILDLGVGTGWSTAQLAKIGNYCIAVDLCKPIKLELSKIFIEKEHVFFERCMANMMQLPFADELFDVVTSMASLHHVTNLKGVMLEISRILKDGGKLILIGEPVIPHDYLGKDKEYINQKNKGFNEHQYTAFDWFKACESAGLSAIDGTKSSDNLNKYYEVDSHGLQNPLPIFIKQRKDERTIKIAFLSQEFSKNCNGGVCRYTYDLAHALAGMGNEVHVITKSDKDYEYDVIDQKVFVHKIIPVTLDFLNLPEDMNVSKKNLAYSYSACLKLSNLIDRFAIQIVEAPLWDAEGFVFSFMKNIPFVVRIETPLFKVAEILGWKITKDLKLANWMEGEATRRADKVIAISKDIGTLISNHHSIPGGQIELCPLGIELPADLPSTIRKDENLNVLFVGRIEKRKGVETLFRAIPSVLDKMPNIEFFIVGKDTMTSDGSYREYLMKNINKKYHSNIKFAGYVDDEKLKNYYTNCDIFVAPSLYESFGLIFLEAMARGKPVIGCTVGGIPEIVENGKEGILIQPDNEKSLAEAIIILLIDNKLRVEMGMNGMKKVNDNFTIDKMAELSNNIYKNIIYKLKTNENDNSKNDNSNVRKIKLDNIDKIDENFPKKIAQVAPEFYKKLLEKQAGISFNDAWNRYFWILKLFDSFDKYVDFKNKNILDVGCGTGNAALVLIKKGAKNVVGVDIKFDEFGYNYLYEIAELQNISKENIKLVEGDICDEHLFIPETFDIIAAVDSFEHINDPEKALRNCKNFLKKGGYIIIDVGPLYYSPIGHHLWIYFPKETDPWAHLRYEDITKVKNIDNWGFRHYANLNKVTIKNLRNYIKSLNLKIIFEDIGRCGEDMFDKFAAEINFDKVPNKDDLFIENVRYILKKR